MSSQAKAEQALLIEVVERTQDAIGHLHDTMVQREQARGLAKLSFVTAWATGIEPFLALSTWLDMEIDRRVEG